jgi:hypothetical protein
MPSPSSTEPNVDEEVNSDYLVGFKEYQDIKYYRHIISLRRVFDYAVASKDSTKFETDNDVCLTSMEPEYHDETKRLEDISLSSLLSIPKCRKVNNRSPNRSNVSVNQKFGMI